MDRRMIAGLATVATVVGGMIWWSAQAGPAEQAGVDTDVLPTTTREEAAAGPEEPLAGSLGQAVSSPTETEPKLTTLLRKTSLQVPTREQLLQPVEAWEQQLAEVDPEQAYRLLASGRLSAEDSKRYAAALRMRADQGDLNIQSRLAELLVRGAIEPTDEGEALQRAYLAAESGDAKAAMVLAAALEQGVGTEANPTLAREWYTYAAEHGMADAWAELGMLHSLGLGGEIDHAKAVELYRQAHAQGSALGARRLGLSYLEGWGVESDPELGRKWLESAGAMGDADAYLALYTYTAKGKLGPRNFEQEQAYLSQAAAAGNSLAQSSLLTRRFLISQSEAQANVDGLVGNAREGSPEAVYALARAAYTDVSIPPAERLPQAAQLLEMAYEMGHPEAAFRLAMIKSTAGERLPDVESVQMWLERADQMQNNHTYQIKLMLRGLEAGRTEREVITQYSRLSDAEAYKQFTKLSRMEKAILEDSGNIVLPPAAIRITKPAYPAVMSAEGIAGEVAVLFVVRKDGSVTDVEIERSTHTAFSEAVLAVASQWKFQPGTRDGEPLNMRSRIVIPFTPPPR